MPKINIQSVLVKISYGLFPINELPGIIYLYVDQIPGVVISIGPP